MMKKDTAPIKDNITELQRTHELIYEQAAILSRSEDIPTAIQGMLAAIGNFVNAERAYIFEDKGTYYSNTFEWCAPGIQPEKDNLRKIDSDTVSPWTDILIHGECIIISEVEAIQEEHPRIYDILKPQNISRVVEAPIMVDNHLIGFLGVDNSPVKTSQRVAETLQILGTFIAITLKNQEGRLESLEQANTALTETNAALRVAYESANQANAAKTNFLSKMSHDIRTPMNGIMGMTTIAIAHIDDKERVLDCLGKISSSSRHLLALINDVLDMSQIESGKTTLAKEEFNLSNLIETSLDMIKPQIAERNHHLNIRAMDITHSHVIGDSLRIRQVFLNILGNAVKYTPDGGILSLSISEKPSGKKELGCYEFIFEDNGIGMSEEFLEKIFQPFEREKDEHATNVQGTGLGMAITKNIIEMMDGDIKVESNPGDGTRFIITIFLELQDTNNVPMPIGESSYAKPKNQLLSLAKADYSDKRVLIVDDNELNLEIASEILGMSGIQIETAENGKLAVDMVSDHPDGYYDIIFMDIRMPVMNGYEAASAIRALDRSYTRHLPIIGLSANAFAEDVAMSRNAGMNAHISKPLDIDQLSKTMHKWLS